jgi:hypothetical protein
MKITVETNVAAPIEAVWQAYTTPADIKQWNAASDDWHTTAASVDLREGGTFSSRMEAKDGSMGFDFAARTQKSFRMSGSNTHSANVRHKSNFSDGQIQSKFASPSMARQRTPSSSNGMAGRLFSTTSGGMLKPNGVTECHRGR